jgi:hypothetical protein
MLLGGCAELSCPFMWNHASGMMHFMRSFIKSPLMMQPSCPEIKLVTRAGFLVMTLIQSNNPPNRNVEIHESEKFETGEEQSQECVHNFLLH